jgi:hypothetical protein
MTTSPPEAEGEGAPKVTPVAVNGDETVGPGTGGGQSMRAETVALTIGTSLVSCHKECLR